MNTYFRPAAPGMRVIFVPWFRHKKSGKVIYAKNYGLKAFRFEVPDR